MIRRQKIINTKKIINIINTIVCVLLFVLWEYYRTNTLAVLVFTIAIYSIVFFIYEEYYFRSIKSVVNNSDIRKIVCVILLGLAWVGVAPSFYGIITNGTIGVWLEKTYHLFDNNIWLNVPVCFSIIVVFIKIKKNIEIVSFEQYTTRIYYLFLIILAYVILYYPPCKYANIVRLFDYRLFLSVLLFLLLQSCVGEMLFYNKSKGIKVKDIYEGYDAGFYTIPVSNEAIPVDIKEYANSVSKRLLKRSVVKRSFAVGITSEWGAGKTTFLNLIKDKIKGEAEIVDFNPWMCRTPEQVTRDFFSTLRHQLSKKHRELSNPIKQYAKLLSSISLRFPGVILNLSGLLTEKGLLDMKDDLSKKFFLLDKPVVVFIDDIDRLESDEVFEVLRLIRNTADLENVVYVVAYDKEYVTSILEEKKIADPMAYLEKIFQVEIQLPSVKSDRIKNALYDEIKGQFRSINMLDDNSLLKEIENDVIYEVITTYRRAQRFARLFSLNYTHLKQNSFDQLVWQEVFWLDLLQMCGDNVYDCLRKNPSSVLKKGEGSIWYYEDNAELKETKNKILLKLFGDENIAALSPNSIRHTQYFNKYFTYQVQFSMADLENMLETENMDSLVQKWASKRKPIFNIHQVVGDYIANKDIKENKTKLKNGLLAILYYYEMNTYDGRQIWHTIRKIGFEDVQLELNNCLQDNNGLIGNTKLITSFLLFLNDFEFDREHSQLDKSQIDIYKDLMSEKVFDVFFERHPDSTVVDLKKKNDELVGIFNIVPYEYKSVAMDIIIDHYSKKANKPQIKYFESVKEETGCVFTDILYINEGEKYLKMIREKCCIRSPKRKRFTYPWKRT